MKALLTLFIALALTLLLIGAAAQPYYTLPGYGYPVDCVDASFPCDGRTCSGGLINPGIDEGAVDGGCYNSLDDNCNNDAGAWDADPQTGADCREPACAGKPGPAGKTCCRSDNDCRSITAGNCGQVYCDTSSHTCETRMAADPQATCQGLIQNLECAAVPTDTACRQTTGFPYTTYACDLRPVNQRCATATSCGAENGRDCACDPATFQCSINRCAQADQLRQQNPGSLLYCYSQCQQLQYTTVSGDPIDGRQCVFNELFNLNNNCA